MASTGKQFKCEGDSNAVAHFGGFVPRSNSSKIKKNLNHNCQTPELITNIATLKELYQYKVFFCISLLTVICFVLWTLFNNGCVPCV